MDKLYSPACDTTSSCVSIIPPPLSNSIRAAVNPQKQQAKSFTVQDEKENLYSSCSYSPLLMSRANNNIGEMMKIMQTK
jgi:hypothetical protein